MSATRTVIVIALCAMSGLAATTGCYQTRSVAPTHASALKRGGYDREIVLRPGPFGVRVGPSSWVRFGLRDGSQTAWLEARKLRVNHFMVVTTNGYARSVTGVAPGIHAIAWQELKSIEVNGLDPMKSVAGVAGGTGLVVLALTGDILMTATVAALTDGGAGGDPGLTRGAIGYVTEQALARPEETADVDPQLDPAFGALASDSAPLFSRGAARRELALFTVASEGGLDVAPTIAPTGGIAVAVRLAHMVELGMGARSVFLPATSEGNSGRTTAVPFLRFGLHLDLDAGRRIALAAGVDIGGIPGEQTSARFLFGLRVRLTDHLQIGLYPWNPFGNWLALPDREVTNHSHLNLVELTWLL